MTYLDPLAGSQGSVCSAKKTTLTKDTAEADTLYFNQSIALRGTEIGGEIRLQLLLLNGICNILPHRQRGWVSLDFDK